MKKNNCLAKIIIITGHSGAGKTTVANKIADILDCPAIHGDEIMFDGVSRFPEKTNAMFGVYPENDGQSWFSKYFRDHTTIRNEQALVELTKDYVDEQLSELLKALKYFDKSNKFLFNEKAVHNPRIKPEIVVFEWHAAPRISYWHNAVSRILVKADTIKRSSMLMERMSHEGITKTDVPNIRYMAIEAQFKKIQDEIDFVILNNYDNNLEQFICNICNIIKDNLLSELPHY